MSSTGSVTSTSTSLGTQIDVSSLVSQLMSTEQQPIINLQNQQANSQALISAYGTVQSALSTFQSAMSGLTDVTQFQGMTVNSSNSTALSATATSAVAPGSYSVSVSALAQAQSLVANGTTSQTTPIGAGGTTTLSFNFGTITGNTLNATTNQYGTTLSSAAVAADGKTVTVASTANLAVGATLTGDGFPPGTTIASITNGTTFVTSNADTNTSVSGLTLQAGATFTPNGNGAQTVTIDSSNNSLQGIAAAINAANIGVTAAIINDGSATPYRLTLTSKATGASSSMQISVAGDSAISSLLSEDPSNSSGQSLTQTAAGQNANFTVNGITVSKPSNTVSDVVSGLTLNLQQISTTPINLTIAQNTSATSAAVSTFVKAYNALHTVINSVTAYNTSTNTGAVLMGDFAVNTLNSQLHEMLNTPVNGAGSLTSLADVGVTFQTDGTLALDQTKLTAAMTSNFNDVAALFDTVGQATDPQISYSSAASTAQAGNYAVNITTLATQGNSTGNLNLNAGSTTIATGTTINVTLDGASSTVALAAGSYTAAQLATMIESAINGNSTYSSAGSAVTATIDASGNLSLTSNRYGSTSNISLSDNAGTSIATFMGATPPAATTGVDVAGTIDGNSATGSGQYLTSGGGNSLGLKIQVNGGALGDRGTVSYSQGFAGTLSQWATAQTANSGLISSAVTGENSLVKGLTAQIAQQKVRLSLLQDSYTKQYTALDLSLASMASTSTYLTQQLTALVKSN